MGPITYICDWDAWNSLRYNYHYGPVLNLAFILTTSGIVTLYVLSGLILAAILVPLHRSEVFMSFLSIAVSILYPAAAGLVLAASIYVEASFPGWTGYSVIMCTVASGILLLAYVLLFVNEYLYTTDREQQLKYKTISGKVISDMNKNHLPDRNNHIWHYTGEPDKHTPTEDFGYQTLVNKPNTKDQ
ncbi:uncharacterized protein LOC128243672 [Mya arenaria]|uniref:uncharacterized protein LOC128243672 n=1 Tax=Mya arenaria TaxID=6604 RepID=UPI0022E40E17|nr:uncharacterized protein LOC128243672 [Mya arenaria]